MKKSNSKQKAQGAFRKLGVVALITATMFFTACNQAGGGGNTGGGGEKPTPTPTPTKYTVTLNQTANGKVTASPEIPADKQVAKDTVITFTATANAGYKIGKWTVTPKTALQAGTGADESSTAKVKITADTQVSVSFEANSNPPTPQTKYTVTLNQTEHGNVTASPAIPTDKQVDKDTLITFTATANEGYKIGKWTVTPKTALQAGTGADGSSTAKVKITADTTVSVSFTKKNYAVNFSVAGTGGTLKAEWDGITQPATSPIDVEHGKAVTFTATAESGYRVNTWTVLPNSAIQSGGGKGETTATLKITANTSVSVSFEPIPEGAILTLATDKNIVSVMAKTEDGSDITVEGCTVNTFRSENQTELRANENGATVTLKGNIIELHVIGTYQIMGPLTALDVSGLAKLQKLNCEINQLTSLNVQGCVALQELNCDSNQLTSLNVSNLTALHKLNCSYNQKSIGNQTLTELNVQGCTALEVLNCPGNKLTELDVKGLIKLKNLFCNQNKLNSLNVKGLTVLQQLNCRENNLTALDVQGLTELKDIDCEENKLKTLNASNLTNLEHLSCNVNQLTELNVQGCTALKNLFCQSNKLDAKAMTALLNALPQREENDNAIAALYTEETGKPEENCKDYTQPDGLKTAFEGAKTKKWMLFKRGTDGMAVRI